jgi:hypothetical protein
MIHSSYPGTYEMAGRKGGRMWSTVFGIPPTRINGELYTKATIDGSVLKHNGEKTESIVRYVVSTLKDKQLRPAETDRNGRQVYVRASNCFLGIDVPTLTGFRDSRFRLDPQEETIFIFHLCPVNERYFSKHYPDGPTHD